MNGHIIIADDLFLKEYTGDIPIGMTGQGLLYKDGLWVYDKAEGFKDSGVFEFSEFPLVTAMLSSDVSDNRYAMQDKGIWSMYITLKIYLDYGVGNNVDLFSLPKTKWRELLALVREAPERLMIEFEGNHFFIIGEKGARRVADNIEELEKKVQKLKTEIEDIIGVDLIRGTSTGISHPMNPLTQEEYILARDLLIQKGLIDKDSPKIHRTSLVEPKKENVIKFMGGDHSVNFDRKALVTFRKSNNTYQAIVDLKKKRF